MKEKLAKNAIIGDGYLWRHPRSKNSNVKYSSTEPELLEYKRSLCPEVFPTGVKFLDTTNHKGRFANAKPMYYLSSVIDPVFTWWHDNKDQILDHLVLEDFGLWYLDDGGFTTRGKDSHILKYYICIGSLANTPEKMENFKKMLLRIFGEKYGNIQKNNSRATENNKTWYIPKAIAENIIIPLARECNVLGRKIPEHLR